MTNGLVFLKICSFSSLPLSISMFSRNTFITLSKVARLLLLPVFCPDFLRKKVLTWFSPSLLAFLFFYLPKKHTRLFLVFLEMLTLASFFATAFSFFNLP